MLKYLQSRLTYRLLAYIIPAAALLGWLVYQLFFMVVADSVSKLARNFAEQKVIYYNDKTTRIILRERDIMRRLAASPELIAWAMDEASIPLKRQALALLEQHRLALRDRSYFMAIDQSGHLYFNDRKNSYADRELRYTLSSNVAKDGWYYATKRGKKRCQINVDPDRELNVTKVWINCQMRHGDKVVGIMGTGIDLSDFIQTVVKSNQVGVSNFYINQQGMIQAASDVSRIDFNSLTDHDAHFSKNILSLFDRAQDRQAVSQFLQEIQHNPSTISTIMTQIDGLPFVISMAGIQAIGWVNVTIVDLDQQRIGQYFLPIGLLLALGMILIFVIIILFFHRLVLSRLRELDVKIKQMKSGGKIPCDHDVSTDEIGRLTACFVDMAATVQQHTETLEHQVEERTATLEQSKQQLYLSQQEAVTANRQKSIFLANMSHEIRTPMNAIIGMTHLVMQTDLTPKQQDYLTKANGAAHALLGIINDILDFSKIEAGKMHFEHIPFNLEEVLDGLAVMTEEKAREKGLEIVFSLDEDLPHHLIGDPLRLGQVLWNITNNAIKFTDRGEVALRVRAIASSKLKAGQVMLECSVQDSGVGLSKETVSHLFQSFTQADDSITRTHGGTGLGLAISKQLVALMGGKIWVESTLGEGSRFAFTAVFDISDSAAESVPFCMPKDIRGMRVLVVEDNAINQQVICEMLQQAGVEVSLANNGRQGVEKVMGAPFDVVLMDLQMPEMDGYEASRLIRQDGRFNDLPIIAMTAHTIEGERERCLAAGMNDHTAKPIDIDHLFLLLRQWVAGDSEQRSEVREQQEVGSMMQETKGELPAELAGFDLTLLLQKLSGNAQLLRELLSDFHRDFSTAAQQIRGLLDQRDLPAAERLAHTIKGTSGNLSATALHDAATQLNDALRQQAHDDLPEIMDRFEAQLDQTMAAIADLQQNRCSHSATIDMAMIKPLLSELTQLVEGSNLSADRCFERLKAQLHHPSVAAQMQQLEHAINSFDFDGAKMALTEIHQRLLDRGELE